MPQDPLVLRSAEPFIHYRQVLNNAAPQSYPPAVRREPNPNNKPSVKTIVLLLTGIGWLVGLNQTALAAEPIPDDQTNRTIKTTTEAESIPAGFFDGLKVRSIGPALMSGRVGDFAVDARDHSHYFVAVCSGGVWKTKDAGITWIPVFDQEGSYSIGCVALNPQNPNDVWVGTGENNSQRSVGFGDGVYRSLDDGTHWTNVGLTNSEHIGMIAVHPKNGEIVYVAAQGPLWRAGGDRGVYKTIDGGKTWKCVLPISENTGANEVHLDPRDPNVLYASAYQRRRHVWTLIDGGPESAIYKSTDAGKHWRQLTNGIPDVDKGRIGLAISPVNPDVIYAIIEAAEDKGGFFRSLDRGETWEKRSDYMTTSPQYFNEIISDPIKVDRVYALDTFMRVTEDGGKNFERVPRKNRHVDDHALWIDPTNNEHLLVGCDGGVYETFDRGQNWGFKPNLPITQFYRVSADTSKPFYYVYGGTQDNNSQGGPAQTTDRAGITSADWFVTVGGDGYESVVDPDDPNLIYCMWQYGGLVRYDRRSGEMVDIKPTTAPGEPPLKWNWDSPLILSPFNYERLYFGANRLFRSDDRGNSWKAISGDLTRGINRNTLPILGRIQLPEAVAKGESTSFFGNSVSLTESPLVEGFIYVGTDDGLVQVTEDGGQHWRKIAVFPGVPDMTYVSCLTASRHQADTVYASFDNHKNGDFKPYLLKSADRGKSWVSVAGDLPSRNVVYSIQEDGVKPNLLFAGTEFGAYFTLDGGTNWIKISGLPTVAVRDLEVQRRENDLVIGTFGRSIYVLDDYTPLRHATREVLKQDAFVFPVKDALRYVQRSRLGDRDGRGSQGASFYAAPNPPFGAVFTYHLKDKLMTTHEQRKAAEKKAHKEGKPIAYPTIAELRAEDQEPEPEVQLVVRNDQGTVVRKLPGSRDKGIHRVPWDLRYPSAKPIELKENKELPPWEDLPSGPLALPGNYSVTLTKEVAGKLTRLNEPVPFKVIPLELATFAAKDKEAALKFDLKVARLQRAVEGTVRAAKDAQDRLKYIRQAILNTPTVDTAMLATEESIEDQLTKILTQLRGDQTLAKQQEPQVSSIQSRVEDIVGSQWHVTSPPTQTQKDSYRDAAEAFGTVLAKFRTLTDKDLAALNAKLDAAGAPWTPGRIPQWKPEAE